MTEPNAHLISIEGKKRDDGPNVDYTLTYFLDSDPSVTKVKQFPDVPPDHDIKTDAETLLFDDDGASFY
jgi:hypothetical protein